MKSLLVKFASFAVVFHMTFGCGMHHGLGNTACTHHEAIGCKHDDRQDLSDLHVGHEHHDSHDHGCEPHHDQQSPFSDFAPNHDSSHKAELADHASDHFGCSHDDCHALQFEKFQFESLDWAVPYLGDVEALAKIESSRCVGINAIPFPDYSHTCGSVRAHLLFGVQII